MNWHTLYDIGGSGASDFTVFLYFALSLLALALLFRLWAWHRQQTSPTAKIITVFALLIAGFGYGMNTWDRNRLAARLAAGDVLQVAGPIVGHQIWKQDVTHAGDRHRRYQHWEIINVGGVDFIWTPGAQEPAFTNAQTPPVDLHDGLNVRIHYVEDIPGEAHQRRIVRLEVADTPAPEISQLPAAPFPSKTDPLLLRPPFNDTNRRPE